MAFHRVPALCVALLVLSVWPVWARSEVVTQATFSDEEGIDQLEVLPEQVVSEIAEVQAEMLGQLGAELRTEGVPNNLAAISDGIREEARRPGFKARLLQGLRTDAVGARKASAKGLRALGRGLKKAARATGKALVRGLRASPGAARKAGITVLKIGGYGSTVATNLIILPFDFTGNFVNSAITGLPTDARPHGAAGWVAVGAAGATELLHLQGIAAATGFVGIGAAFAPWLGLQIACSNPKLAVAPHDQLENGKPVVAPDGQVVEVDGNGFFYYCEHGRAISDFMTDQSTQAGKYSGAWLGKGIRKLVRFFKPNPSPVEEGLGGVDGAPELP
jgi:hypothetical protein